MREKEKSINTEIQETLMKIREYEQLIDDAENALDAAIENLEEMLAEAIEAEQDCSLSDRATNHLPSDVVNQTRKGV